jgi:DNA-binding transcriptional MerR regulator
LKKKMMTIAELGRRSGVGVETVRYYQRLGLLAVPELHHTGTYRRYGQESLAELEFVRHCKGLGFSLKQVAVLVEMRRARKGSCVKLHAQLAALSSDLEAKKKAIEVQLKRVRALQEPCGGGKPLGDCDALASLETVTGEA